MTYLGIGSSGGKPVNDTQHLSIVLIFGLLQTQCLLVVTILAWLVKHAQHSVQPVAWADVQTWYLHNDTVVGQAVDKRVGQSFRHDLSVIVVWLTTNIQYRLFYITHLMSQQVYCHHWDCVCAATFWQHVGFVSILCAQILTEAQRLRR